MEPMLTAWMRTLAAQRELALTALRVVMGVIVGYAGQLKVFRGDMGVSAFHALGVPLAEVLGPVLSLLELVGGFALFVGLFTRVLGVVFALEFLLLAALTVHVRGILGARLEYLLLAGALVLACHGAGALALDRPGQRWEP
jgi:putative oxidoreductase